MAFIPRGLTACALAGVFALAGCVTVNDPPPEEGPPPDSPPGAPDDPCIATTCVEGSRCVVDEATGRAECVPGCEGHECPEGQHCELVQVQCVRAPCPPMPQCVPDSPGDDGDDDDEPTVGEGCAVGGCSSQLCTEEGESPISTCEWRPEYACYRKATCERQDDGRCGWTMTPQLRACLDDPPEP